MGNLSLIQVFFLGMAVFNRPTNALIAVTLTVYVLFHRRKHFIKFAFFAGVPALLLFLYSHTYLDSILALGQGQVRPSVGESYFDFFNMDFFTGFTGLLFSPSRGILVYTPVFIFSFIFIIRTLFTKEIEPLYRYLSISIIFILLLYSKWIMWWGGHSFGYRLLTEIVPLLTILLAIYWEKYIVVCPKKSFIIFKVALYSLTLYSIFIHFLGAFYEPCGFNYFPNSIDRHLERLWDLKDSQISRCIGKMLM